MGGIAVVPAELLDALEREAAWAERHSLPFAPGAAMFRGCVENRRDAAMVEPFAADAEN